LRADLILCDWAEAIGGKLYVMGAGWNVITVQQPASVAVALLVYVDWTETNTPHELRLRLVTEDGQGYPEDEPIEIGWRIEIGRPPGVPHGTESTAPLAAKVTDLRFVPGGYRWELSFGDAPPSESVPFRAIDL
jgi:hypothetical protein